MNPVILSLMINSALYLIGLFVAGVVTSNPTAWKYALFTAALCYLSAFAQITLPPDHPYSKPLVLILVVLSIAAGAAGGIVLLIGG